MTCQRGVLHVWGEAIAEWIAFLDQGSLGQFFGFGETLSFATPRRFRIPMLNKGDPPIELPSLWGMRVQAESLLTMHPRKH